MKESMWGYILILLGIGITTIMIMLSNMTTTNQQDYYLLKEVTNASMLDAIDLGYYREYGEVRVDTQRFVEIFMRRFAESISKSNTYKIDFYSVYENPPSVNIRVTSKSGQFEIFGDRTEMDVINSYDAVLEYNNKIICDKEFVSLMYAGSVCAYNNLDTDGFCKVTNFARFNKYLNSKAMRSCFMNGLGLSADDEETYQEIMPYINFLDGKYLRFVLNEDDISDYADQWPLDDSSKNDQVYDYIKSFADGPDACTLDAFDGLSSFISEDISEENSISNPIVTDNEIQASYSGGRLKYKKDSVVFSISKRKFNGVESNYLSYSLKYKCAKDDNQTSSLYRVKPTYRYRNILLKSDNSGDIVDVDDPFNIKNDEDKKNFERAMKLFNCEYGTGYGFDLSNNQFDGKVQPNSFSGTLDKNIYFSTLDECGAKYGKDNCEANPMSSANTCDLGIRFKVAFELDPNNEEVKEILKKYGR